VTRLGVLSDLHWPDDPATRAAWHNPYDFAGLPARLDAARELFARAGVDAVVVAGDLTHRGDEPSARAVLARLADGADRPVLVVAGNHDCFEADDRLAGCGPGAVRTLDAAGVEVAGTRAAGVAIGRDRESGGYRSTGGVPSAPVVVSHFPVLSRAVRAADRGWSYPGDLLDHRRVASGLAALGRPVVVLSGHIHIRDGHVRGPLLQLSAGALIEPPFEAAVVDVERARGSVRVRREVHALGPSAGGRDPVLAPAQSSWTYARGRWRGG
jgi:predicted phosphodiesterase